MDRNDLAQWLKAEIQTQASYAATGDLDDFYVDGHLDLVDIVGKIFGLIDDGWLK